MTEQKQAHGRGDYNVRYQGVSVDSMIIDFMKEHEIPGLTLSIVQAPYIPRVAGYGYSNSKEKRLASVNTLWPAGPISQAFAAVAVMQLYQDHKIDLQDSIRKWVPELSENYQSITVLDLLRHSSGLMDYAKQDGFVPGSDFATCMALVSQELVFAPGSEVLQSATNFLLLSEMIERVSKLSYHDFIWRHQIEYLRLQHTGFAEDLENFPHENIAESDLLHQVFKKNGEFIDPCEPAMSHLEDGTAVDVKAATALRGYHDIWASAQDISYWDIALAGGVLIHDAQHRKFIYEPWEMKDGTTMPAVAGWQFYQHRGLMDIKGIIPGYSTFLSRFTDPKELVCVTILANKEGVDFTNLGRKLAGAFGDLMATGYDDQHLQLLEGQLPAKETIEKLERELKRREIPLFAKFDHAQNAREVGIELRETTVLVFGAPKVGTNLMLENQSIALELPLKIAVWEDASGSTWLGFVKCEQMAAAYGMAEHPIVANMQKLLEQLCAQAASVYA